MTDFGNFSLDFFSLKGKVAIITGANQGLGMAYAAAFAKAGADLFIPHFTPDTAEVKQLVEAEGRRVEFLQGGLTKKEYLQQGGGPESGGEGKRVDLGGRRII